MANFQLPNDQAKVSLWQTNSSNEKAPVVSGKVQMSAEFALTLAELAEASEDQTLTLDISLWENNNKSSDKSPDFTGGIREMKERDAKPQAKTRSMGGRRTNF
jgi:hypothetical protein